MKNKPLQLIITTLLLILVLTLILVPTARAQELIYGSSVPAGQTVQQTIILTGNRVSIDGTVDGDVVAIGTDVVINGNVTGSLVAAGSSISINGQVDGSLYATSLTLDLGEEASIGRDLYYLGTQLATTEGSTVERNVKALTLGATFNGEVTGDIRAIIGPIEIINAVLQLVEGKTLQDLLPSTSSSAVPESALGALPSQTGVQQSGLVPISWSGIRYSASPELADQTVIQASQSSQAPQQIDGIDWERVGNWLLARLRELVTLLVIGGLVLLIFPRQFQRWTGRLQMSPLASIGWGLVVVVIGFSAAFLLAILILPLAIFLFSLTLSDLALFVLALGYFGLGLAFTLFILFVFYVAEIIVVYLIGRLILQRWAPRAAEQRFWPLLLGATIYVLLLAIPALGWVISVITTLFGVGAAWMVLRQRNPESQAPAELEPTAAS